MGVRDGVKYADGHRVPTFKNARYLFARREWEHWSLLARSRSPSGYGNGEPDDVLDDSVRPIIDAGLAELVDTDHRITDEVWLEPTPGTLRATSAFASSPMANRR